MNSIDWKSELRPSKLVVDHIRKAIYGISSCVFLWVFGYLRADDMHWGYTFIISLGIAGTICFSLLLWKRWREFPPSSFVARINELSTASSNVRTRNDAAIWAHSVYSGLSGLGLTLPAAQWADLYNPIVYDDTPDDNVLRLVKESTEWLNSLGKRFAAASNNPVPQPQIVAGMILLFKKSLDRINAVNDQKGIIGFWNFINDIYRANNCHHIMDQLRPIVQTAMNKQEGDDISPELIRLKDLLGMYLEQAELAVNNADVSES